MAATLDGQKEAGTGPLTPGLETLRRRLPVEGIVELDGVEVLGVVGEVLTRRELLGIEALAPVRVRPARTTDADIPWHSSAILRKIAAIRRPARCLVPVRGSSRRRVGSPA